MGDAVVMADSGLLERVLANLIDNALRYASESPVRVTASTVGAPGTDRRYRRGLRNTARRGGADVRTVPAARRQDNSIGVGLGLSVAKGFVEAMGGTIAATDTPGGGLTVRRGSCRTARVVSP